MRKQEYTSEYVSTQEECRITAADRFLTDIEFFPDSVGSNSQQLLSLSVIKHWMLLLLLLLLLVCISLLLCITCC